MTPWTKNVIVQGVFFIYNRKWGAFYYAKIIKFNWLAF